MLISEIWKPFKNQWYLKFNIGFDRNLCQRSHCDRIEKTEIYDTKICTSLKSVLPSLSKMGVCCANFGVPLFRLGTTFVLNLLGICLGGFWKSRPQGKCWRMKNDPNLPVWKRSSYDRDHHSRLPKAKTFHL